MTWGTDIRLTYSNPEISQYPSIAVSNTSVHVAWLDGGFGPARLWYKLSTNNGITWSNGIKFTNNTYSNETFPSISASGNIVHLVWIGSSIDLGLWYNVSTNNGTSWAGKIRLTNTDSRYPSIAVSGQALHIVWTDYRDYNINMDCEIYYKRNATGNIIVPSAPILVSPENGATNPTVLDWNDVDFAASYNLEVATDVVFSDKIIQQTGITTSRFVLPYLVSNKTYYWRVNAVNQAGTCQWSEIRNFFIIQCNISVEAGEDEELFVGYGSESTELTAVVSEGTGPYSYLWTPGGATTQSITVSPTVTTTYSVQVTDNYQCTATDEVTIFVYYVTCGNNGDKVMVCHNGMTLCISVNAVPAHIEHGDYLGPCREGLDNISNSPPSRYFLYENYPNPFNPVTRIKFDLPENTNVRLIIYDILGREVTILVDGIMQAGRYVIDWNASEFASGIYFYRITANNYKETRKMFLIK